MLSLEEIKGRKLTICDLVEDKGPFSPQMVAEAQANDMVNGRKLTRPLTLFGVSRGLAADEITGIFQNTLVAILGYRNNPTDRSIRKPEKFVRTTFFQQYHLNGRQKSTKKGRMEVLDPFEYHSMIGPKSVDSEQQLLRKEQYETLREGIKRLSDDCRQIIELHYYEGLNLREIADRYNMKQGTVKSRLNRGLKSLLDYMESKGYQKMHGIKKDQTPELVSYSVGMWKNVFKRNKELREELSQIAGEYGISIKAAGYLMKEVTSYLIENRDSLDMKEVQDVENMAKGSFIQFCILYGDATKSKAVISPNFAGNLEEKTWEMFKLRYHNGLELGEIATIMGLKTPTVYWHLSNVRRSLRTHLIIEGRYRQKRA